MSMQVQSSASTYRDAGVDTTKEESTMNRIFPLLRRSFSFRQSARGQVCLDVGFFANVVSVAPNLGVALSIDGVGTKIIVAQMMQKYDTIGIDCVAMNVNDVICVGAEPTTFLDYIAVENIGPQMMEDIVRGLYKGAKLANISIPGGETAQVGEMLKGVRDRSAFDLAGVCVGIVPLDRLVMGQNLREGDVIVGLHSSGLHSNGYTLARKVFFERMGWNVEKYVPEFRRTLGEELLEPTIIYSPVVNDLLASGAAIKALANVTSDGFLNLARIPYNYGYVISTLPESKPVFSLLQELGDVSDEEMYKVYNMGIGFCIVVSPQDVERVLTCAREHGINADTIGHVVNDDEQKVVVEPRNLISKGGHFVQI